MNIDSIQSPLAASTPASHDNPKLQSAAHEFEASLMQQFLKPLQSDPLIAPEKKDGSDNTDTDADDNGGSTGALMSFGSEALAKAISERGGFGIASKILDHFRTLPGAVSPTNGCKT